MTQLEVGVTVCTADRRQIPLNHVMMLNYVDTKQELQFMPRMKHQKQEQKSLVAVAERAVMAHFGSLIRTNHHLNATHYLNIVADHSHRFVATVNHFPTAPSFHQDNSAKLKPSLKNDFSVLR